MHADGGATLARGERRPHIAGMSRIAPLEPAKAGFFKGLLLRIAYWLAKRKVGKVPTPMRVKAHHLGVMIATGRMDLAEVAHRTVDAPLKSLVQLRTAQLIGCPY